MVCVSEQAAPQTWAGDQQWSTVVDGNHLEKVGVQLHAPHPQVHLICQAQVLVVCAQKRIVGLQACAGVGCCWGWLSRGSGGMLSPAVINEQRLESLPPI